MKLRSVESNFPEPPYPADTRTAGWTFNIDIPRLNQADTWALAAAEVKPWLMWLWAKSWTEIPAGSLPADDDMLAAKLGCSVTFLQVNRKILLRNWYRCSDNRLYHPYITTLVVFVIRQKELNRERVNKHRKKKKPVTPCNALQPITVMAGLGLGLGLGVESKTKEPPSSSQANIDLGALPAKPKRLPRIVDAAIYAKLQQDAIVLLEFLNKRVGREFRPTPTTLKPIIARLKDGFTVSDCKAVIVRQWRLWKDDTKTAEWLRPSTLFGDEKFNQYIGKVPTSEDDDE